MTDETASTEIDWSGRRVRIEHRAIAGSGPTMIFLHEGLGSVSQWRDFPDRLCAATGLPGFVFSRPAYGRSTPRPADERWDPDFLHRQAYEVLPALRRAIGLAAPVWLFGHSDGASIALLHAARYPESVVGAVVLAPHLFVEEVGVKRIAQARIEYETTDMRQRMARHHDDTDSAFYGWNGIWLDPRFRAWNLEAEVAAVRTPVLAIQGRQDEYGTMDQLHRLAAAVPHTKLLEIDDCGHAAWKDQPEQVIAAVSAFVAVAGGVAPARAQGSGLASCLSPQARER